MGQVTTVGTTILRVIEDKILPDSRKTGITKAILKNGDLLDYALEEMVGSLAFRAERMYEYAKRGDYVYGLPSGQFTTTESTGEDAVVPVLTALEGAPVTLDYIHYEGPNILHFGWTKLIQLHGYNPATNQLAGLAAAKGTPVYLDDMVVAVPAAGATTLARRTLDQWGTAPCAGYTPERTAGTDATRALMKHSPVFLDPGSSTEYLLVKYVWESPAGLQRAEFTIPVAGLEDHLYYFHTKYRVGGVIKYWTYADGAGTYPDLDAVFDRPPLPDGSFFPFVYFRFDKQPQNLDPLSDEYKTSKKLVSYLGMSYDEVSDAINENPDIADVEQAMMMMAVPANTTHPLEQRYLWDLFNNLYMSSPAEFRFQSKEQELLKVGTMDAFNHPGLVVQDTRFKLSIEHHGVYRRRVAGSVGEVGSHSSELVMTSFTTTTEHPETMVVTTFETPVSHHYYRRQVSTGFYDEIEVIELTTNFHIYGDYMAIGEDAAPILIIPLDYSITVDYSAPDREILYARSMHYVFNSRIITKIRWYQTELFQFVMLVVAVVITVLSYGSAVESIGLALAAGSYGIAASIVITMVIEFLVIQALFKLFVKAVGVRAAFVIAIVAALVGLGGAMQSGSVAGSPFASELLAISSGLTQQIGVTVKSGIEDLIQQGVDFQKEAEEQNALLEKAEKLLESDNWLSPFVIFGETPQDYYNRTVHSGNIGVVAIESISYFVEMSLSLPKLNDSLGGTPDVQR